MMIRPEYPVELIQSGVRGEYAARYRQEDTNVVVIEPELHEMFPDSETVNKALRDYLKKVRSPRIE